MTETQKRKAAEKIFSAVKKHILAARKANRKSGAVEPYRNAWKRQSVYINARESYSVLKSGKRKLVGFSVTVEGEKVADFKTISDLESTFLEFNGIVCDQTSKRGWDGLEFRNDKISLYDGSCYDDNVRIISLVVLQPEPCKEYDALKTYINKHAPHADLGYRELYSVAMEGKKGYLYEETGENDYLESHPSRCLTFLNEIKKARSAKDTMTCRFDKEIYMDPDEYEFSCRDQIECSGEKRHFLRVVIKSPSGKVKYDNKLF